MNGEEYSAEFYKSTKSGSLKSAKEIVPILVELISPKSVVDVGCGTGEFTNTFKEYGVKEILGIDGEWLDKKQLSIKEEEFTCQSLEKKIVLNKKFDLAISLEVAEHIPGALAEQFIESLTSLSDIVFFSAAIPLQGGTNHVNEQWINYWVNLFSKKDYVPIDCIRKKIWNNKNVMWWYSQNSLLFAKKDYLKKNKKIALKFDESEPPASKIHPRLYMQKAKTHELLSRNVPNVAKKLLRKLVR